MEMDEISKPIFLKTFKLGLHTRDKTIFQYKNYISI